MRFDERFVKFIKQSAEEIESGICKIIDDGDMCPISECVPCDKCLDYVLEIITKV